MVALGGPAMFRFRPRTGPAADSLVSEALDEKERGTIVGYSGPTQVHGQLQNTRHLVDKFLIRNQWMP